MRDVFSVAAFAENEEIYRAMLLSDRIREATLDRCCAIPGYSELSPTEQTAIYDSVYAAVEAELSANFTAPEVTSESSV